MSGRVVGELLDLVAYAEQGGERIIPFGNMECFSPRDVDVNHSRESGLFSLFQDLISLCSTAYEALSQD